MLKPKPIVYLLLCLASFQLAGQNCFNNYYKTGYSNVGSNNVIVQSDSNIVFCNYITDTITHLQNIGLIKIDKSGNEIIKKKYNLFGYDIGAFIFAPNNFMQISNSSFFFSGAIPMATGKDGLILAKINSQTLDTFKTVIISDVGFNLYLNNIIRISSNKFLLAGNKYANFNSQFQYPLIVQIDSNIVVTNSINIINPTNFAPSNIMLNPITKQLLLAGITPIPFGVNQPLTLMHIDTLGNLSQIVSVVTASLPNYPVTFRYSAIDTSYVAVGGAFTGTFGPNQYLHKMSIAKFNAITLQPKWQYYYGDEAAANSFGVSHIDSNGDIVCSAQYAPYSTLPLFNADYRGVIVKVNKNGQVIWARDYNNMVTGPFPHDYREGFFGIDKTKDKGYVAVGAVIGQPNGKAWAVKTDSMGCVSSTNCPSFSFTAVPFSVSFSTIAIPSGTVDTTELKDLENVLGNITTYPNPTSDKLYFISNLQSNQIVDLSISNTLGQIIYTKQNVNLTEALDISFLKSGVYFLKIQTQSSVVPEQKTFKVVKE